MTSATARHVVAVALFAWLLAGKARADEFVCGGSRILATMPIPWAAPDEVPVGESPSPANIDQGVDEAPGISLPASIAFGASRARSSFGDECRDDGDELESPRQAQGAPMTGILGVSLNAPAPYLETYQRASAISESAGTAGSCAARRAAAIARAASLHKRTTGNDNERATPACDIPTSPCVVAPPSIPCQFGIADSYQRHGFAASPERPLRSTNR